jgi:hypothetical protein
MSEFEEFPKISRLSRPIIVTEKLDGTNAQIYIQEDGTILIGSRNRYITPEDDNYGFAKWVERNKAELMRLGPGTHYGEWWGNGIQRNYGLKEKRFSLFNVHRWGKEEDRPSCCGVVPTLYEGIFDTKIIEELIIELRNNGSKAAPGFMNPEGVVIYHKAANKLFKKTIEKDEEPKSLHLL